MEEDKYTINWLGLFIKVIIFVVVALLAIWLVTKLTSKKDKGLSIEENSKLFTDSAVEYFRANLPEDGSTKTVTLSQLISWDYIEQLTNEKGKICDIKKSKAKIEQTDDYYSIKTEIICGNDSKTTYVKLGSLNCEKCDVKIEGLEIKSQKEETKQEETTTPEVNNTTNNTTNNANNTTNNTTSSNTTTNNNTTTTEPTILYEYVKKVDEYSDWYVGKVKGTNIENSTKSVSYSKYCQNEEYNYYTVSYVSEKKKYTYTLELKDYQPITNNTITDDYFTTLDDYQNYIDYRNQNLAMVGGNSNAAVDITSASKLKSSSLTSKNFTYTISNIYKTNNKYYVDVTINVKNLKNVTPYYASNIRKKIYFVPVKFTISSNSNTCITDKTENASQYQDYVIVDTWNEYIDIYRYKITVVEYKYSNQTSLTGYTKTGNYKQVTK